MSVERLTDADRSRWEQLFRAYIEFYERDEPQQMYDRAWREFGTESRLLARGARFDGGLAGIVHFLVHPSTSSRDVCYLQDLFVDPEFRGRGVARSLILAVAKWAKERDCDRVYWTTKESNVMARRLYDRLAETRGFIVYRMPL